MALFKRKGGAAGNPPAARSPGNAKAPPPISEVNWADLDNIRAEWPAERLDLDQDMLGWHNGLRMAQEDEHPGQRFNEAEYMTRGLQHYLYGDWPLTDADGVTGVQLVLGLLERFTAADYPDFYDEFIPRIRRLPLAIMKLQGWQPTHLGGDGRVTMKLETPGITSAVACTHARDGNYLEYFFRG